MRGRANMADTTNSQRSTRSGTNNRSTNNRSTNKTAATKSTSTARRQTARTRQSTGGKRAQASRANAQTQARARRAAQPAKTRVEQVQDLGRRAIDLQVGAALEARDTVTGVVETYTDRTKAERRLKQLERRGKTTRTKVEREARK